MAQIYNIDEVEPEELMDDLFKYMLTLEEVDTLLPIKEIKQDISVEIYDDSKISVHNKLYFNGESDSNQTRYEQLAGHLHIATKAKTDIVGKALHTFLRQILDDHKVHFSMYDHLEFAFDNDEYFPLDIGGRSVRGLTLKQMVEILSDYNSDFSSIHDLNDGIYVTGELSGYKKEIKIKRFVGDIDVWDIYRIASSLGIWRPEEKYEKVPL